MLKCCNNALNCVCQMNKRPCIGRHLSAEGGAKISDSDRSRNSNERYAAYCPGYSMKVAESIEWVFSGCNWAHCAGENNGLAWRTAGCLVVRWSGGDLAVTATGTLTMDMCLSSATPPRTYTRPKLATWCVCVLVMHMSFKYNYIQIHSLALFGRNMESFYTRFAYAFPEYFYCAES